MRYSKPRITNTLKAVSTIQQQSFTENPTGGVYKNSTHYYDLQIPAVACSASAYEADE
jgi:hypothetical protein